jgi:hypothetical protein
VGNDRASDQTAAGRQRLSVAQAAEVLGISVEAIRGRIKRNTLEHERTPEGVFVFLDANQSTDRMQPDADRAQPEQQAESVVELMREMMAHTEERIAYLERQVEEEREARRRADMLLAQLVQRIPELEAPTETPQEPPESPTGGTEQPGRVEPQPQVEGQQTPDTRPWWQRWFGSVDR